MKPLSSFTALLFILLACSRAGADDVLIIRNQWQSSIHVWVNDTYQGHVLSGQVAYMPREGFVTPESGIQADGTLKMDHAYGGWQKGGTFRIRAAAPPVDYEGQQVSFFAEGSQSDSGGPKYWTFGKDKLTPPNANDEEFAIKMLQGTAPGDILSLLKIGAAPYALQNDNVVGMKNDRGQTGILKVAGAIRDEPLSKPETKFVFIPSLERIGEKYRHAVWINGRFVGYVEPGTVAMIPITEQVAVSGWKPEHHLITIIPFTIAILGGWELPENYIVDLSGNKYEFVPVRWGDGEKASLRFKWMEHFIGKDIPLEEPDNEIDLRKFADEYHGICSVASYATRLTRLNRLDPPKPEGSRRYLGIRTLSECAQVKPAFHVERVKRDYNDGVKDMYEGMRVAYPISNELEKMLELSIKQKVKTGL